MKNQLSVGGFIFGLPNKTAYDQLVRRSSGGWVNVNIMNAKPLSHNTGQGPETITISGKVHGVPGMDALDSLRTLQATRKPQTVVDGPGRNFGRWKIMDVTETQSNIIDDGTALVVKFSVTLEEFSDGTQNSQNN